MKLQVRSLLSLSLALLATAPASTAAQAASPTMPAFACPAAVRPTDPVVAWAISTAASGIISEFVDVDFFGDVLSQFDPWPLWYCQYGDGTVVFNEFRFYRSSYDVLMYFTGRPGSHDCDAWSDYGRFCTEDAYAFARQHGGIVAVGHATR